MSKSAPSESPRSLNRQILALALPAFGALVAEPLFVLADSAFIGHLGTLQLAGLTLGSTVIQTVVGLMVFLSYATTPAVARAFGAGDLKAAYTAGRNGLWAGLLIGTLLAMLGWFLTGPILQLLGGSRETLDFATEYLRPSLLGLPGMLLVLAAVGVLRGLQDTKTPLYVAGIGAVINIGLNWLFIYPLGLGVAGSATGTSITQWGMALTLSVMVVRGARAQGISLSLEIFGVLSLIKVGSWLMLRTLAMRIALLLTVVVATGQGAENLAAYQLVFSIFNFLAFALDSLAIAAQALLGKELGARNLTSESECGAVVHLKNRLIRWSLIFGIVTGFLCLPFGFFCSGLFTTDPAVAYLFAFALLVVGISQPLAAYVFILDGVLIGAQDFRYLALTAVLNLAIYLPFLFTLGASGFIWLWITYALIYMGARALTLGLRVRSGLWVR